MTREDKLWSIVLEIYKRMYKEATPPGNWDEMMESGETKQEGFFDNYVLSQERSDEIIEQTIKETKRLSKYEKQKIKTSVYIGSSPRFKPKKD